ncbi:DNA polymerase lambda-like isoform X2 [Bacillus rossius redtenbacheri]|uniref:DNA polymerase lambda-like isoform X2 n=1 Tax=Bacillus rossius redtenbacheri TaxID=93214 RepID=UPI002FDD8302
MANSSCSLFCGITVHILPSGIGSKRLTLLENLVKSHGGQIAPKITDGITYVLVEEKAFSEPNMYEKILDKASDGNDSNAKVVSVAWLSECLKRNEKVNVERFELLKNDSSEMTPSNKRSSELEIIQNLESISSHVVENSLPKKLKPGNTEPSNQRREGAPCNTQIVAELQKLADAFRNRRDQWRALGYEKAISAIKAHNKPITSFEEARALPGVGAKMAAKVVEVLECGSLRKVKEICEDNKSKALALFTEVWGVGPATADSWYQRGFRSLDDLRTKANLTRQQKIGLKLFEDLRERIPREEVERIGSVVRDAALGLDPGLEVVLCGSYRRSKATCGDVDVLIAIPDGRPRDVLPQLLGDLKRTGFITDDLVSLEVSGNQKKYLGVCRLPGAGQ